MKKWVKARAWVKKFLTQRLSQNKWYNQKGFTFVEILMTLTIIAVLFVPVMQLFSHSLYATAVNMDLITSTNLAQTEMEKTINLNLTKEQLKQLGTLMYPPPDQKPIVINRTEWRVQRELVKDSDPLEVRIHVFREGRLDKPAVTLVTLVEDMMWEAVKEVPTTT